MAVNHSSMNALCRPTSNCKTARLLLESAITHPVNKVRLKHQELKGLGLVFFAIGKERNEAADTDPDQIWKRLRDRWERSHAIRAVFSGVALIALTIATVI